MDIKSTKSNLLKQAIATDGKATDAKVTEVRKSVPITAAVAKVAAPKTSAAAIKSAKSEFKLSGAAQQAHLSNELDQKVSDKTELLALNKSAPQNAGGLPIRDVVPDHKFLGPVDDGFNALAKQNVLNPFWGPKVILSTGSGDDQVGIYKSDGRVYVAVNGKLGWSGTPEQFKRLTIDTGAGADQVDNFYVDGAKILTGEGDDIVRNSSSGSLIDTGAGSDSVGSTGDSNHILTGSDTDAVRVWGNDNTVDAGDNSDDVIVEGDRNVVARDSSKLR